VVADVGRREDVRAIADKAIATFGGFDTWVMALSAMARTSSRRPTSATT
jgi:hypothetical protein